MTQDEQICSLALTRIPGLGLTGAFRLVSSLGSATRVFEHRKELSQLVPGVSEKIITALNNSEAFRRAEQELTFCEKNHIRCLTLNDEGYPGRLRECDDAPLALFYRKYSINSLVYWVTYVHNVVYSFYRSMIYCYINSTQRCAGSIVIDIIPTNGADKRKFFPFAPYFPVTNVIKRYFYPYFPAIIGIKGYSFPYFPYLSGIMKIKTALYSLFSRLDWHKTVVFPCLGEIYEGIRSLSWEIPVT